MEIILLLLAVYSLTFMVRETAGPFDIFSKLRRFLMQNKYMGVFFFKLLDCPYCTSFYTSVFIYFLFYNKYALPSFLIFILASAASSLIISDIRNRLNR